MGFLHNEIRYNGVRYNGVRYNGVRNNGFHYNKVRYDSVVMIFNCKFIHDYNNEEILVYVKYYEYFTYIL